MDSQIWQKNNLGKDPTKYNFKYNINMYKHIPEAVLENDECQLLWYFNVNIDKMVQTRRQDTVFINRSNINYTTIDAAIPRDQKVLFKEQEMVNKYKDLKVEVQKLRSFKARVILIIAGALETVSKFRSQSHLKQRLF